MTTDLPPLPDGPPIPEVVYTPEEAVAWIRTMTVDGLVTAARRDPERFPSRKTGRWVGFSGEDILAIIAATKRVPAKEPPTRRLSLPRGRRAVAVVPNSPAGGERLVAKPRAPRGRKAS